MNSMKKDIEYIYSITEQLENKFVAQENGLIITNVDSVAEFRAVIEDEKSSISKELKELNENNETVEFDIHQVGKKMFD